MGDDKFKKAAIELLNRILSNEDNYWSIKVKKDLGNQFKQSLYEEEKEENYNLRKDIDFYKLLKRIKQLTGVKFTKKSMRQLQSNPNSFRLVGSVCFFLL